MKIVGEKLSAAVNGAQPSIEMLHKIMKGGFSFEQLYNVDFFGVYCPTRHW